MAYLNEIQARCFFCKRCYTPSWAKWEIESSMMDEKMWIKLATQSARLHWKKLAAVVSALFSIAVFVNTDFGRALFFPAVTMTITRGGDATQASLVALRLSNSSTLAIRDVAVHYNGVRIVFDNRTGIHIPFVVEELPIASVSYMRPAEAQEFSAFENVHAFGDSSEARLVVGDSTGPSITYFAWESNSHRPHIRRTTNFTVLPPQSPIYHADIRIRAKLKTVLGIPHTYDYRLIAARDVAGRLNWQMVPVTSQMRFRTPGHTHLVTFQNDGRGDEIPNSERDAHLVLRLPLDQLHWHAPRRAVIEGSGKSVP
jgi:hypothetical protein